MTTSEAAPRSWVASASSWLTPRRLRTHAAVLAVCLWGVCAVDFATPGLLDRAGNIKFQDFLPFYISAQMITHHRAGELYDPTVGAGEMQSVVREPTTARLPYLYGPQVGLLFVPLAKVSFPVAARIWVTLSMLIYVACLCAVWKSCPNLHPYRTIVALAAIAFPPLFHFFVRGQLSALVLACFTAAFLALYANRLTLAGVALGLLAFKPQFLVAIPLVLLLTQAWKILTGLLFSAAAQLVFARVYFGADVLHSYLDTLTHASRWVATAELPLAPIQMHSLRSFWSLLLPAPAAFALYILSSIAVIALAAAIWKSSSPLAVRFSALTFAAVLCNPHLFIYDLLVLAPALMLLANWAFANRAPASLPLLLYLAFLLPLFGPLSRWTHLQLSVIAFVLILWTLHRSATLGHKLASDESRVV